MKRHFLPFVFVILLGFSFKTKAGSDSLEIPLRVSLFSNSTVFPHRGVTEVFKSPVHPGITVGTGLNLSQGENAQWNLLADLGYFYHHNAQQAVFLYPELHYNLPLYKGLGFSAGFGIGYLHSFPEIQRYELKGDGTYEQTGKGGRAQGMSGLKLGIYYDLNEKKHSFPYRIFVNYRLWVQGPFVKSYVPVMPNTAFHLGIQIPLKPSGP